MRHISVNPGMTPRDLLECGTGAEKHPIHNFSDADLLYLRDRYTTHTWGEAYNKEGVLLLQSAANSWEAATSPVVLFP